jgi:anti-anti-sigma factor
MNFNIETIRPSNINDEKETIYKVSPGNSLDSENSRAFDSAMSDLISKGAKKVIIDFIDLLALDSMGIGILISTAKKLKKENGELIIIRCKDQVMTLLKPINIENLIKIFRNHDDGINYFTAIKK